jgi:hypothetical protein
MLKNQQLKSGGISVSPRSIQLPPVDHISQSAAPLPARTSVRVWQPGKVSIIGMQNGSPIAAHKNEYQRIRLGTKRKYRYCAHIQARPVNCMRSIS